MANEASEGLSLDEGGTTPKIVFKRYGGKALLAKWIVSHFPEHRVYLEPFCGSCAVLFAKPRSFVEIVNDMDLRLMNLFEQVRSHPLELASLLWATPYAKANWRKERVSDEALEDARLLMAECQQFYGGASHTSTWAIDKCAAPHKPKSEVWADWFLRILPAANRLRGVQILSEDALKAISRVADDPNALIYVDPPYLGHEAEYEIKVDYQAMVDLLRSAKAKVIVSEFDAASSHFEGWHRTEKNVTSRARTGAHKTTAKKNTEVLFANFPLEASP